MRIALVGGTGKEGEGLALRWAAKGHEVRIGSRDPERGRARAAELSERAQKTIEGADNSWAVRGAEVVILAVPYPAHAATLEALKTDLEGKLVVDITVPLQPPGVREVHLPPGQSAALEARSLLSEKVRVAAGLHHVSSVHLAHEGDAIDCDVLVCADEEHDRTLVLGLVADLGLRGVDAGVLRNAVALEALTPVLLHINKRYKIPGAGIRITGLPG